MKNSFQNGLATTKVVTIITIIIIIIIIIITIIIIGILSRQNQDILLVRWIETKFIRHIQFLFLLK